MMSRPRLQNLKTAVITKEAEEARGWWRTVVGGWRLPVDTGDGNERQETVGASRFEWRIMIPGF